MLTALCVRSKAHWGYDAEFMRRSVAALRVRSADIALGRVLVAVDGKDRAIGVASVIPEGESLEHAPVLDHIHGALRDLTC